MQEDQKPHRLQDVVVFDFDGTLIKGQSGALLSQYLLRNRLLPLRCSLKLAWWGIRYECHLPYRQSEARELVFGALKKRPRKEVDEILLRFYQEQLLPRYRAQARHEVARCEAQGNITLLVSATFEPIAQAAVHTLAMDDAVATKMVLGSDGNYTGDVEGPVVAGSEKYRAVVRWCDEHLGAGQWELVSAYGDHVSDKDLLAHAQDPYAVCPKKMLRITAQKRGWTILNWDSHRYKDAPVF